MKTGICVGLLGALAFSSSAIADNVIYTNSERELAPANSLFFDRNGALYPSSAIDIPADELKAEADSPFETLSLKGYYREHFKTQDAVWLDLWRGIGFDAATPDFELAWQQVQDQLRRQAVKKIDEATNGGEKPLFILIQGFNNTFMEAHDWYRIAERDIRARVKDPVFVELFWDGGENPYGAPVWGLGQNNLRFVGLEFRRFLAEIQPDTPIRIITHSSGGPLIANVLGNASAPFESGRDEAVEAKEHYFERAAARTGAYAPPRRKNMRIAMIVPAGARNTFEYFKDGSGSLPDRFIFGLNPKDFVVHKALLGCRASGDTCLATDLSTYCENRTMFMKEYPSTHVYGFDFSKSPRETSAPVMKRWESHTMVAYLNREDWPKLLDALVLDRRPEDETPAICGETE